MYVMYSDLNSVYSLMFSNVTQILRKDGKTGGKVAKGGKLVGEMGGWR